MDIFFDILLKPPQLFIGLFLLRATQTHLQYIELALRTRLQDLLLMGWFDYNFIDKHYGDVHFGMCSNLLTRLRKTPP